jgi:O-antigen biosynthesis protein
MFEYDDYALRLIGLQVVCTENVFVHHWGHASFSQIEQAAYKQLFETNRILFEEKWGRPRMAHSYRPGLTFH